MLNYSQFNYASIQAVVFMAEGSQFSQPNLLATILGRYAGRFDGPVQALPLPDDAPPEIPRVILQSRDGVFKVQAGLTRVDSFWIATQQPTNQSPGLSCVEVLEHYIRASQLPLRVGRLALVITRVAELSNPAQSLIDRFCNAESREQPFNNSESFEIHNHKRYLLRSIDLQINSWVRCKAVTLALPQQEQKKLAVVEQDINTLQEEFDQNTFDAGRITDFFTGAAEEADSILRIYFPEEV